MVNALLIRAAVEEGMGCLADTLRARMPASGSKSDYAAQSESASQKKRVSRPSITALSLE
jgi:hypothetical protein